MIFSIVSVCLEGILGYFSGQKAKLDFDGFIETVPVITFFLDIQHIWKNHIFEKSGSLAVSNISPVENTDLRQFNYGSSHCYQMPFVFKGHVR